MPGSESVFATEAGEIEFVGPKRLSVGSLPGWCCGLDLVMVSARNVRLLSLVVSLAANAVLYSWLAEVW